MYQVDWLQSASHQLTNYWMNANSAWRQAITTATYLIDKELANDPLAEANPAPETDGFAFSFRLQSSIASMAKS